MGEYRRLDFDEDMEDNMVDIAYDNSYRIVIREVLFSDIVEESDELVVLAHDPTEGVTISDLEDMRIYYEMTEYYERCGVLKELISERNKKKG